MVSFVNKGLGKWDIELGNLQALMNRIELPSS